MKKPICFLAVAFLMFAFNLSVKAPMFGFKLKDYNNNAARNTSTLNKPLAIGGAVNAYNRADILIATAVSDVIMHSSFLATGINSEASRLAVILEFIIPTAIDNGNSTANGATSRIT